MDKIEEVCRDFEFKKFEIDEFQSRLGMIIFEDEFNKSRGRIIEEAQNSLELIRFAQTSENYYSLGMEVARQLVADMKEFERTHKVRRYLDESIK